MGKRLVFLSLLLLSSLTLSAFEKLPPQYQVSYGHSDAPIKVVEYFSLNCLKCIEHFKKDFKAIKEKYIDSKKVFWIFHVNPMDLLSLQAMVCLGQLSQEKRQIFWEVILDALDDPSEGGILMQVAMETFGNPISQLTDLSYLKNSIDFKSAYKYLKQPDLVTEMPTVEINGKVHDEFPSLKFLEKQFSSLLTNRKQS